MVPRSLRALTPRAVAAACAVLSAPSFSFAQSNPSAPQGNGAPVDLAAAGGVVTGSATNPIIEVPSVVNGSGPLGGGSGAQAAGGVGAGAVVGNGVGAVGAGGADGAVAGPVANAGAAGASVVSGGVSSAASDSASVGAGRNQNISMASIAPTIRNGVGLVGNSGALIRQALR